MMAPLGRGAMGEVWRADDLVLCTTVAVKLLPRTTLDGRERIFNEVRLARQITHTSVCRVFDVGEADGRVFFTMQLIEGEDLASLLRRAGRLSSEKVTDIGRQLCAGLAAAHDAGVLHRDLKPSNVLIDSEGAVRITDFGIAITRVRAADESHAGTPRYMAPEQRLGGAASERTDLYAMGLILYELAVGRHAFPDAYGTSAHPPSASALVPDLDPRIERAISWALAPSPADRPHSATALAHALAPPATAQRPRTRRIARAIAAAAAVVLAVTWFIREPATARLTERDALIIADFSNSTGEPVFDGTLKVALAVALEQSPFLKVFPDEQMRETLTLMRRAPDIAITPAIAREIARREQLKALVTGSIAKLGRQYVIGLEAVNAETGDVIAREQAQSVTREETLTVLGTAVARLRGRLGESLNSVQRFDVPLPRATTSSLEALQAYSLALDRGRALPRSEAIPHLQRAIEIDPNFALAHALLSGVYANNGRWAEAPVFARKAFDLRDRVSERERFFISWRYYVDALQAWDKALPLAEAWTSTYPREPYAFNSFGMALTAIGRTEEAAAAFRKALQLDQRFVPVHANLGGTLIALDRLEEAKAVLQNARSRSVDALGIVRNTYVIALLQNDSATMQRVLNAKHPGSWTPSLQEWQGWTAAWEGRLDTAHSLFRTAIGSARNDGVPQMAAWWGVEDAGLHALVGQCQEARAKVAVALAISRDSQSLPAALLIDALCGSEEQLVANAMEARQRFSEATAVIRIHIPIAEAAFRLRRGQSARALEILETLRPVDLAPAAELRSLYLRGEAYLAERDGERAAAQFRNVAQNRGRAPFSPLPVLAHLGLARAAVLGSHADIARREYEAFLMLWKNADEGLASVAAARREYAGLIRAPIWPK
jgi:tetratricopeptide (TPR) repeat protein